MRAGVPALCGASRPPALTRSAPGSINVWDLAHMARVAQLGGAADAAGPAGGGATVHALLVHGARLYSGNAASQVGVWALPSLAPVARFAASDDIVCALALAKGHLYTASYAAVKVRGGNGGWVDRAARLLSATPARRCGAPTPLRACMP